MWLSIHEMVVYILCTIYRKREIEHPREFNLLPILLLTQNKDGVPSSLDSILSFYPFLKWLFTDYSQFIGKGQIEYPRDIYTSMVNMHCKTLIILIYTFLVITINIGYTFTCGSKSRNQNKWLTCRSESLFALDINRKSLLNCVITVVPANRNFTFLFWTTLFYTSTVEQSKLSV